MKVMITQHCEPNATEWYIFEWLILCYVNFTTIKKKYNKTKKHLFFFFTFFNVATRKHKCDSLQVALGRGWARSLCLQGSQITPVSSAWQVKNPWTTADPEQGRKELQPWGLRRSGGELWLSLTVHQGSCDTSFR